MNFTLKQESISVRGQTVIVRELTAGARAEMLEAAGKASQFRAQIVMAMHCVVDDKGEPLFGGKDFDKVAKWPADVIQAVSDKVLELSGANKETASPKP